MPTGNLLNLSGFKLTFDDEFNAFSSNGPSNYLAQTHTGTWDTTLSYGERKLNDETERYSDPTVGINPDHVSGGVLDIHAAPAADPAANWGLTYTSGVITTFHSFAQEYGYFEMRAELPSGAGMWPAFWLLSQTHVWPPELDPLEAFGASGPGGDGGAYSIHSGLVATGVGGQGNWFPTNGANLYTQYNTFGVDWEPDTITFYFNGRAYASVPTPADFHQPMYMIANLAVGGHWAGAPLGESGDLKIDYIRAFSGNGANPAVTQQAISSPDGRGHDFYGATDANGNGAQGGTDLPAPAPTTAPVTVAPSGPQTVGSGPDDLVLRMSEDAYQGDAQFVLLIDGRQLGGTLATGASHAARAVQTFDVRGDFGAGVHRVGIYFTNNFGGAPGADRNLFLNAASIDGATIQGAALSEYVGGEQDFRFQTPGAPAAAPGPVANGTGRDTLALSVSEDAYLGNAQFTISVDGRQIGGTMVATAQHFAGQSQTIFARGSFGAGPHTLSLNFLDDAFANPTMDRNLYLDRATIDGTLVPASTLTLFTTGAQSIGFAISGPAGVPVTPAAHAAAFGWQRLVRAGGDILTVPAAATTLASPPPVSAAAIALALPNGNPPPPLALHL